MGLKSLPILNKSGISMYWCNIWDSIKLYKKFSLSFYFINDIVHYFINENLYYYCIYNIRKKSYNFRKYKGFKRLDNNKLKSLWGMRDFYLGKILILNNQGWVIILVNYYVSRRCSLRIFYEDATIFKDLFKTFRSNNLTGNYVYNKYKFKF